MFVLDSAQCQDTFPADNASGGPTSPIIVAQNGSSGGYAQVIDNDVYVQLAYMPDGAALEWTDPVHVAPGNLTLAAGTRGIRFRNYRAGQVATVSAGLSEPLEPALNLTAAGIVSSTPVKPTQVIYAAAALVNNQNTVAEMSLVTGLAIAASPGMKVAGGKMGIGDLLRFTMAGGLLNNTGAAKTYLIKVLVGQTAGALTPVFGDLFAPTVFGAVEFPWSLEVMLGLPALSPFNFDMYGLLNFLGTGGSTNGSVAGTRVTNNLYGIGSNGQLPIAIDVTKDFVVDASITFNASSNQLSMRTDAVLLEYAAAT